MLRFCSIPFSSLMCRLTIKKPMWHLINKKPFGEHASIVLLRNRFNSLTHLHMRVSQRSCKLLQSKTDHLQQSICGLIVLLEFTSATVEKRESLCTSSADFPEQHLSRQLSSHTFGSGKHTASQNCSSLCVFVLGPLPSIPLLPLTDRRGVRGNGRDHYITKHPAAIVLSNCHKTLPQHSPQTSGQVLCATARAQGRREGGRKERESGERQKWGKAGIRDEKKWGDTEERTLFVLRVQSTTILMWKYLTFVFPWPR